MALEQFTFDLDGSKLNIAAKVIRGDNYSAICLVTANLDGREYGVRYDMGKGMFIDDIFGGIQLPNKTFAEQDKLRKEIVEIYTGLVFHGFISL